MQCYIQIPTRLDIFSEFNIYGDIPIANEIVEQ